MANGEIRIIHSDSMEIYIDGELVAQVDHDEDPMDVVQKLCDAVAEHFDYDFVEEAE